VVISELPAQQVAEILRGQGQRQFAVYGYFFAIFMPASGLGPFLMGQTFHIGGSYEPFLMVSMGGLAVTCCLMVMLSRRPELAQAAETA